MTRQAKHRGHGLLAAFSLTLVGCALSPQQLSPQPRLTGPLTPVGQGQPVVVRVADGRPSPVLGTRGGIYSDTSTISVQGQDILPRLQAEAEAAVRLLGFTPSPNAYNAPQLTLTLADVKYVSPKETYVTEATISASFRVAASSDIANFYRGKQMRMIIRGGPGGGFDLYSRLLARFIVNHIPGKPTIVSQNMPAGAGIAAILRVMRPFWLVRTFSGLSITAGFVCLAVNAAMTAKASRARHLDVEVR